MSLLRFYRVVSFWPRMAWKLIRAPQSCRDAVGSAILCLHNHDRYHTDGWKLTLYFGANGYEGAIGEPDPKPEMSVTVTSGSTCECSSWTVAMSFPDCPVVGTPGEQPTSCSGPLMPPGAARGQYNTTAPALGIA